MIKINFKITDFLFLLILFVAEIGTLGLPLNVYQFVICILLGVELIHEIRVKGTVAIPKDLFYLLLYILVISLIFKSDFESIKAFIFFAMELLAFFFYVKNTELDKLYKLIYRTAVIFSIFGLWQEIAFLTGHPNWVLIDVTKMEIRTGLLAVSSFYSEPAHCAMICAFSMWIVLNSIVGKDNNYTSKIGNVLIIIFTVLTQSLSVYIAVMAIGFVFVISNKKYRQKFLLIVVGAVVVVLLFNPDIFINAFERLDQFKRLSLTTGNDLSAVAIVTNINVALESLKDGYILGTGFDTHRIIYWEKIHLLYSKLYMYLNSEDASSLYIRVLSEFGVVGLFAFMVYLIKKFKQAINHRSIDMLAIIAIFAAGILRNGQYQNVYSVLLFTLILNSQQIVRARME